MRYVYYLLKTLEDLYVIIHKMNTCSETWWFKNNRFILLDITRCIIFLFFVIQHDIYQNVLIAVTINLSFYVEYNPSNRLYSYTVSVCYLIYWSSHCSLKYYLIAFVLMCYGWTTNSTLEINEIISLERVRTQWRCAWIHTITHLRPCNIFFQYLIYM